MKNNHVCVKCGNLLVVTVKVYSKPCQTHKDVVHQWHIKKKSKACLVLCQKLLRGYNIRGERVDFYRSFRGFYMRRGKEKRTGQNNFYPAFTERKPDRTIFGSIMLKILFSKIALANVKSVHRNLQIIALNISIIIFFTEMTSFLF